LTTHQLAAANGLSSTGQLRVGQRLFVPLPRETGRFLWPVRGRVARAAQGLQIVASSGTPVRASRTGRVAVATRQLSGWGRTVILDHVDGYLTVYAGLAQILVAPGADVRQGLPVGIAGPGAVHFEIRYGTVAKNPLTLLPR
jgi:murein DD-endopeptidase MepM/ murein hydrolase activator NlpD